MAQSLKQLKEENAAIEAKDAEGTEDAPQAIEEETVEEAEVEAIEGEDTELEADADLVEGDEDKPAIEAWMQTDGDEKKFTDGDIGAAKHKLRAKLESKHSTETDELKARIAQLEQGGNAPKTLNKPMRADYANTDDPDDAYTDALVDWKLANHSAKTAATTTKADQARSIEAHQREVSQNVDSHYERAVKLSADSGIEPAAYQSADLTIRRAVESVFPNQGDVITDGLIANLGEGSEKVFFSLGINEEKRTKFISLLQSDKTGLKASMYLGKLSSELSAPERRTTRAPKPAADLQGTGKRVSGNAEKRKYDAAHKAGKTAKAFKLKRAAKKAGADTSTW